MKAFLMTLLLPALLALNGCVVVVGTDTEDGAYWGGRDYSDNGVRHDGDRLSRDVAHVLGTDVDLVAEDIRVSSEDGVVVLKGSVRDVTLLEKALASARGVEGVDRVISKITVDAG